MLAILMGLGVTMRRDPRSRLVELLRISDLDSDRAVGLTESWEVWVRVVQAFPAELIRFLIDPSIVEDSSRSPGVKTVVYLIPVEYVAIFIIVSATTIVMLVNYLSRWRRRAEPGRSADASPQHDASTDCPSRPIRSGEAETA
jgi:hypothetical protein